MILTSVLQHGGKNGVFLCSSSSDNVVLLSGSIMFSGSPGGKSAAQTSCQKKKSLSPFKDLPCFQKFPVQITKTERKAVIEVPWNCCM